ncbi:hypothetical protein SAMN05660880_02416 [Luteibacter sp. 22Crub2.1]|nr:hypothetical protein [Luteibacter sp. 1214]SKB74647.1 hypothetical protein SAMN05660880_02416 [Luteibacter sp. 22Crub2.1]
MGAIAFTLALVLSFVAHGFPLVSRAPPDLLVEWEGRLTADQSASYGA